MALSTLFLTGFEHGFSGTPANMVLGGGIGSAQAGTSSVAGASARNGSYGLHIACAANTAQYLRNTFTANNHIVCRLAVRLTTRPTSPDVAYIVQLQGTDNVGISVDSSGIPKLDIGGGTQQIGPAIGDGNWHVIEVQVNSSGTTWTCDWKVDGVAQTQATFAEGAAGTLSVIEYGNHSTSHGVFTADYDDVIVGTWATAATDWYGDGQVLAQFPGSDGTHVTVANFRPGDSGTNYSGTVTTACQMVDDAPATGAWTTTRSTTDSIGMSVNASTAYMEIAPATTAQAGAANAVRAVLSYSSSSTSANLAGTGIRNSGGTQTDIWGTRGGAGASYAAPATGANGFKGAIVAKPVAGWTATEVNALRWRFGGCTSGDVSPVPTVQGLMLEVDWPVSTATSIDAGPAAATGAGVAPTSSDAPSAPQAAATGAAPAPTSSVSVTVPTAAATGAAPAPTILIADTRYPDLISSEVGLVSYWRLGEASGSALDSKDSNPASQQGSAMVRNVPGLIANNADGAAQNDGSSGSYFEAPYKANMNVGSAITVECWVKLSAYVVGRILVAREASTTCWFLAETTNNAYRWYVRDTNNVDTIVQTSNTLVVGAVQHVVGVYDVAAGRCELYVNGVSVGAPNRTPNAAIQNSTSQNLDIGGDTYDGSMTGVIDEVAFYSTALTAEQIKRHYYTGRGDTLADAPAAGASAAAPAPTVSITVLPTSIDVAPAGATAAAPVPTSSASATVPQAAATGSAPAPTSSVRSSAPQAAATGAAPVPTSSGGHTVPQAAATGSAPAPTSSVRSSAPTAGATGAAAAPTVTVVRDVSAPAATATGAGVAPSSRAVSAPSAAQATGAAPGPTASEAETEAVAAATGAAIAPTSSVSIAVSSAAATAAAQVPTLTYVKSIDVAAAQATGAAVAPSSTSANSSPPAAQATGAAPASTASESETEPVAQATGAAIPPTSSVSIAVPSASATATAWPPQIGGIKTVDVPAANATASAPAPDSSSSVGAPSAAASAAAPPPTIGTTGQPVSIDVGAAQTTASAAVPSSAVTSTAPAAQATGRTSAPAQAVSSSVPGARVSGAAVPPTVGRVVSLDAPAASATGAAYAAETSRSVDLPPAGASASTRASTSVVATVPAAPALGTAWPLSISGEHVNVAGPPIPAGSIVFAEPGGLTIAAGTPGRQAVGEAGSIAGPQVGVLITADN